MRQHNFDSSHYVMYIYGKFSARRKLFAGMYVAIICVTISAPGGSCRAATFSPQAKFKKPQMV
jgi:hypothetical protein